MKSFHPGTSVSQRWASGHQIVPRSSSSSLTRRLWDCSWQSRFPRDFKSFLPLKVKSKPWTVAYFWRVDLMDSKIQLYGAGDEKRQVYCCSETAQSVLAGISRIWVLADYRYRWSPLHGDTKSLIISNLQEEKGGIASGGRHARCILCGQILDGEGICLQWSNIEWDRVCLKVHWPQALPCVQPIVVLGTYHLPCILWQYE